jgi:hypothetical protein
LRLRPIMMTMLVATLGLLPAALSHAIGSDSQRPFAIVIVGGLIAALIMSVFLLPTLYVWVAGERDVLPQSDEGFEVGEHVDWGRSIAFQVLESLAFGVCMKLAIAIVLVLLWLFFPAANAVRWCRRWRARREAANFARIKAAGVSPSRIFFRFSCNFHKEFPSSTACAQPSIEFWLRCFACWRRVSPAQMCGVLKALSDRTELTFSVVLESELPEGFPGRITAHHAEWEVLGHRARGLLE